MRTSCYTFKELERMSYIAGTQNQALLASAIRGEAAENLDIDSYDIASSFPSEDCLQDLITHAQALAKGRVTKADVVKFVQRLEEKQYEIARASEYGREELDKLECDIAESLL